MQYDTITIDTQTVMGKGFDFDSGLLAQLKQFKGGPVKVVVSAMVVGEILKHLKDQVRNVSEQYDSAHRRAIQFGLREREEKQAPKIDYAAHAQARLDQFLSDIGANVIEPDNIATQELVKRYLSQSAPFSRAKKAEFPDAISLLSLEKWAAANGRKILAVSNDGDWEEFSKGSPQIEVIKTLEDALARLQGDTARAHAVVERMLIEAESEVVTSYEDKLEEAIAEAIGDYTIEGTGDSRFDAECEFVSLSMQKYRWNRNIGIQIVRFGPDVIAAKFGIFANVEADARFSLKFDIEDETFSFGDVEMNTTEELKFELLLEITGDFDTGEIEVASVDIVSGPDFIDFGYLDAAADEEFE